MLNIVGHSPWANILKISSVYWDQEIQLISAISAICNVMPHANLKTRDCISWRVLLSDQSEQKSGSKTDKKPVFSRKIQFSIIFRIFLVFFAYFHPFSHFFVPRFQFLGIISFGRRSEPPAPPQMLMNDTAIFVYYSRLKCCKLFVDHT